MTTIAKPVTIPENLEPAVPKAKIKAGNGDVPENQKAALRKVSQEFESLFIGMMLKSMRATVGKDTLTGGGHGEEVYRSLLDQEYANSAAQGGGFGLAKLIEQDLVRQIGYGGDNDNRTKP